MKIVATSDTHYPFNADKIPEGDIFIHAGDLMYDGFPNEWEPRVKSLADLSGFQHKIFVPGNHDLFFEKFTGGCLHQLHKAGVFALIEKKPSKLFTVVNDNLHEEVLIGSCPYVTGLQYWAFSSTEEEIEKKLFNMGRVDILVCHSPPKGLLAGNTANHWGLQATLNYIDEFKPKIVICGHVHESYGRMTYGSTEIYNVSMCDRAYNQVNKPVIIEF